MQAGAAKALRFEWPASPTRQLISRKEGLKVSLAQLQMTRSSSSCGNRIARGINGTLRNGRH